MTTNDFTYRQALQEAVSRYNAEVRQAAQVRDNDRQCRRSAACQQASQEAFQQAVERMNRAQDMQSAFMRR